MLLYTHIDLLCAKDLDLEIKLIIDDQPNFLHYSRDKLITGHELFGQYVDLMFPLKEKKLTNRTKQIFNILWGALSEKNCKKVVCNFKKSLEIGQDCKLFDIRPFNDDNVYLKYSRNDTQYKSGFARIAPFLISKGRKVISDIMIPYNTIIVRCHTDGVIFSGLPVNIKTGNGLGELAFEGYSSNCEVINSNIVLGEFLI